MEKLNRRLAVINKVLMYLFYANAISRLTLVFYDVKQNEYHDKIENVFLYLLILIVVSEFLTGLKTTIKEIKSKKD
tara:strand:+ start:281 stop:508 length:228 start_codon:yes stop_codon:yes gene_type:complete